MNRKQNSFEDLVIIPNNLEAICYFDFVAINGEWHVSVLIINDAPCANISLVYVPYKKVKFVGDLKNKKRDAYLKNHINFEKKRKC